MTTPTTKTPDQLEAWKDLVEHHDRLADTHLSDLFTTDADRASRMSVDGGGLHLDYSKNLLDTPAMASLLDLAQQAGLSHRIEAMFTGQHVNVSEDRPALHIALRLPRDASLVVDGVDIVAEVHGVLDRMADFARRVRSGEWQGHTGKRMRTVINIGIGGSDLGPRMTYEALRPHLDPTLEVRFVSNVDPADLHEALRGLNPEKTLFIVSSKSFRTIETMTNAGLARTWLTSELGDDAVANHFVAVSANIEEAGSFGVPASSVFGFWDWVGGRYSMDSAIGLSTMIAIGPDAFGDMLGGFHEMDNHFRHAPFEENIPVIHGLLAVWYRNFFDYPSQVVVPYSQYLHLFPAYIEQLTMESNGKRVTANGAPVSEETGAIYWGQAGTNAQHSFFQLLHQGTTPVPADLIGFTNTVVPDSGSHDLLTANLLAQSRALAFGRGESELRAENTPQDLIPHRSMPGNRPNNVILGESIGPRSLGALVALYEHSVFVQGTIWGIDSFDQWGVELGKSIAVEINQAIADGHSEGFDSSTNRLLARYLATRP